MLIKFVPFGGEGLVFVIVSCVFFSVFVVLGHFCFFFLVVVVVCVCF